MHLFTLRLMHVDSSEGACIPAIAFLQLENQHIGVQEGALIDTYRHESLS